MPDPLSVPIERHVHAWASLTPPGGTQPPRSVADDPQVAGSSDERSSRSPLPDAERATGPDAWSRFPQMYADVLQMIDRDPAVAFLRSRPFAAASAGNPNKRRNGELRRALKPLGLSRDRTTLLLHALNFIRR